MLISKAIEIYDSWLTPFKTMMQIYAIYLRINIEGS